MKQTDENLRALAADMLPKWYKKIEDTFNLYLHTAKVTGCNYTHEIEVIQSSRLKCIAEYENKIKQCNKILNE